MSVQPTEQTKAVAVRLFVIVEGPFIERVTLRGTVASVLVERLDHLCHSSRALLKDNTIIALRWADSKVQRCVCVCLAAHALMSIDSRGYQYNVQNQFVLTKSGSNQHANSCRAYIYQKDSTRLVYVCIN